jgi:hypothetical protein
MLDDAMARGDTEMPGDGEIHRTWGIYLENIEKVSEHGHLYLVYPLQMVIVDSFVSLPAGNTRVS